MPAGSAPERQPTVPVAREAPVAVESSLLSPSEGWVANGLNIYLTTDAGRSWRPIGPKENDRVGFAIGLEDTGGPHSTARSYKTSDGGLTWTMTEAFGVPTGAGAVTLAFPTARDGWFAVNELTRAALFHTIDGGTNWREVALPDLQPNEVVLHVGGPRFFGANNGLLAAAVEDRATGQDRDVV